MISHKHGNITKYDKDGKYVPQREVRAVFPKADAAFGSMKELIQAGLEEDAVIEGKRSSELSAIVDEIQRTIPKTEAEIAEEQVEQADRDVEAEAVPQRQFLRRVDDEAMQYQPRGASEEDVYPTEGVHWGIAAKIISEAEARAVWKAIADIEKRGYSYPKNIRGESFISSNNFLMVVDTDYRYPSIKAIYEFTEYYKSSFDSARRLIINARGIQSEERKAIQIIEDAYGPGYVIRHDIQDYSSYVWEDRRGERTHGGEPDSETQQHLKQNQLRTQSYTDREVLEMAAENMSNLKLSEGERSALEIFNKRLEHLKDLEQQREEQRRILAALNKADKPNVDEIRKTRSRLNVLGRRISAAENDILAVEDKKTLKKVLHAARRVTASAYELEIRDDYKALNEEIEKSPYEHYCNLAQAWP